MAAKLDQSSPAEPRLRQPKPPASPSLAPKVSIFGAKAGFVIPKNKLAGSLVVRGGAKNETPTTSSKEENTKHVQRKTKWGPDLTLDSAVRKARALAYQTRVEQITKELNSAALEIGGNEGSMSTAKGSNSDGTDNLKENEGSMSTAKGSNSDGTDHARRTTRDNVSPTTTTTIQAM